MVAFVLSNFCYTFFITAGSVNFGIAPTAIELIAVTSSVYLLMSWSQAEAKTALKILLLSWVTLFFMPFWQVIFFISLLILLKKLLKI